MVGGPAPLLILFRPDHDRGGRPEHVPAEAGAHVRRPNLFRLGGVDLEEKTIEKPGDRCEVCGTKLTGVEIQAALESGGPALCSVHADEVVPVADEDDLAEP